MTKAELIELLQEVPDDAIVFTKNECGYASAETVTYYPDLNQVMIRH